MADDPRVRANRLRLLVDATGLLRSAGRPRPRPALTAVSRTQPIEIHLISATRRATPRPAWRAPPQAQFPTHPTAIVRHPRVTTPDGLGAGVRAHHAGARRGGLLHAHRPRAAAPARPSSASASDRRLRPARAGAGRAAGRVRRRGRARAWAGRSRLEADYFKRVAAMEFAVKHDDGLAGEGLGEAEIVLIGVSRTGKTPLSMFLGYLGYKTANVPLVRGIEPPAALFRIDRAKVVGLTIDPERLARIRGRRLRAIGSRGARRVRRPQQDLRGAGGGRRGAAKARLSRDRRHEPRGRGGGAPRHRPGGGARGRHVKAAAALVALLARSRWRPAAARTTRRRRAPRRRRAHRRPTRSATSEAAPTPSEQEATTVDVDDLAGSRMVAIYLDLNEKVHPVRRLVGSGRPELRPVLEHLLAGPTPEELAAGYTSAIPPGVQLLGIEGEGTDTVTVDLSSAVRHRRHAALARSSRWAQLVHTVDPRARPVGVRACVQLDGQPRHGARRGRRRRPADRRQRRGRHAARPRAVAAAGRPGAGVRSASPAPPTPSRPRACSASRRRPRSCRPAIPRS